jgi:hypothetical protein
VNGVQVGDVVRVERDETKYPSKGTWPRYRGQVGTVVAHNYGEIGVVFGAVKTSGGGQTSQVSWFLPHELRPVEVGDSPRRRQNSPANGPDGFRQPRNRKEALPGVGDVP